LARERLEEQHRAALLADHDKARGVVAQRQELQLDLRASDRRLQGFDEAVSVARATASAAPNPSPEQRQLLEHRDRLRWLLADPAASEAEQVVRHADRNRALTGDSVTAKDLEVFRARRAAELRSAAPSSPERRLELAGIDAREYRDGPAERRERLIAQATRALAQEQDLLAVVAPDGEPAAVESARRWLPDDALRRRTTEELTRVRAERRRRRATEGTFRVR
jgi:hypothetical protein